MAIKAVRRKDSPYWWIRGTVHGRPIYRSTGITHGGKVRPPKIVTDKCRKIEEDANQLSVYGGATFKYAAYQYLQNGGSPRFLTPLIEKIGDEYLHNIDQGYVNDKSIEMYGHCTSETRNRQFFTPFIAVWNSSSKGNNPLCQKVEWERPKRSKKRSSTSSKAVLYEDVITFINALDIHAARVMFFLFWTGCRPIEAFSLRDGIDVDARWFILDDTKTDTPRGVPIHECLVPLMTKVLEDGGFLNSKNVPYPTNRVINKVGRVVAQRGGQIQTPLYTARDRTGINITPYNARHTVATYLIYPGGVGETVKNEILGHGNGGDISLDYIHLPRQAHIDAINKLPDPRDLGLREDLF